MEMGFAMSKGASAPVHKGTLNRTVNVRNFYFHFSF